MTATYTNQPGTVDIDTVRHEIDDKDTSSAMLTDEEIQYYIDSNSHILLAAAAAATNVAGRFASDPKSKKVGDLTISYGAGGQSAAYKDLAKSLRSKVYRKAGANIHAGGISRTGENTDADRGIGLF